MGDHVHHAEEQNFVVNSLTFLLHPFVAASRLESTLSKTVLT